MAQIQPLGDETPARQIALSYRVKLEGVIAGYIPAIMAQQAILLSMREQLQLDIDDDTLLDLASDDPLREAYVLDAHASLEGTYSMHLMRKSADALQSTDKADAIWSMEFPFKVGSKISFPSLLPQLEVASREQMLEIAEKWKLNGTANRWIETSQLPESLVANLAQMDLISQSVAVREAHRLIRVEGESPELLGALVRGYAHLSWRLHVGIAPTVRHFPAYINTPWKI